MTSVVFDKLRAAMGRPASDHDVPAGPPATPNDTPDDLARRIARVAADLDRFATAQRAIESKLQAIEARHDQFEAGFRDAEGSRAVATTELRQAVAKLQARATETAAERTTLTASVERLDEAHAQLRQAQNRSEERLDGLVAAERTRGTHAAAVGVRDAQELAARVTQQTATLRDEWNERDAERSRAFAARIAAAHVTSFVALVAALAAAAIAVWKQL